MKRPVKITLALALLVALLAAGIFGGETGRHFLHHHHHRSLQSMADSLPADKRELFTSTMGQAMQDSRALYKKARHSQKEAQAILAREDFDKAAYLAQVQQAEALRSQVRIRMAQAVADIAESCTQEERIALATTLKGRRSR